MYQTIKVRRATKPVTVICVFAGDKAVRGSKHAGAMEIALAHPGFRGDNGEVVAAGKNMLALGLGDKKKFSLDSMRVAGARLVKVLARMKVVAIDVELCAQVDKRATALDALGQSLAEGISLAAWRFDHFDGKASKKSAKLSQLDVHSLDKTF